MTAVPLPTAVTRPFSLTVATDLSLVDHATDLSSAPAGETVATSCVVPTPTTDASLLSSVTPATCSPTVTAHSAVSPPSSVVAVTVHVPTPTGVTAPLSSTMATSLLEDVQATPLSEAVAGSTVASSCDGSSPT